PAAVAPIAAATASAAPSPNAAGSAGSAGSAAVADARPVLPRGVEQFFVPLPQSGEKVIYHASALGAADVALTSARYGVNATRRVMHRTAICDGALPVDWEQAEELKLDPNDLGRQPLAGASFAPCPTVVTEDGVSSWRKLYERWLRTSQAVTLFRSPTLELVSEPGESEGAFRGRLQMRAREQRDAGVEELRKKYAAKTATLEERLAKAEHRVQREEGQAGSAKMDAFVTAGTAVLGMLLGRKRLSVTTASRMGTAVRRAGRSYDQAGDVTRARESAERVREQIAALEDELQSEIAELGDSYDAQKEELESVDIRPTRSDIQVHFVGIGWGDEA
ncbi:MAG TPA: ATP-binding protein, partial [Gemmatimonadaceae bacterium]